MVSLPSDLFDGTAIASFEADGIGAATGTTPVTAIDARTQSVNDTWSSSSSYFAFEAAGRTSFNVTYFHCDEGSFWKTNGTAGDDESSNSCELCTTMAEGDVQVLGRLHRYI